MDKAECKYCRKVVDVAEKVADLTASTLYLTKDQSYKGRCILAFSDHKSEPFQLTESEWQSFTADMRHAAKALSEAFHPAKINYGAVGDTYPHLHFHLVPKYENGKSWNTLFDMQFSPERTVPDAEFERTIEEIRKHL
ncbi:MAG: HIT family protein [Treponemataceae bacterium]|nr:MAG: HIT family protein [Treponemataceae bacterium]